MRPVTMNAPLATGPSNPVILDYQLTSTDVLLAVEIAGGASLTTQVEYTADNPYSADGSTYNSSAIWFIHPTLTGLTASGVDSIDVPARAVRINNTVWASGQATLQVVQAGASC